MKIYELTARFDARKSFYHKAMVGVTKNTTTLFSYETPVATIKKGKLKLLDAWNYSNTTRRHVKEFVIQHNMEAQFEEKLKQLNSLYHSLPTNAKNELDQLVNKRNASKPPYNNSINNRNH